MPDSEKLLEQAKQELAKIKQMLHKSTFNQKYASLAKAAELEKEQIPSQEEMLNEEHRFAGYEQELQEMMVPIEKLEDNPKKKIKNKNVKKKVVDKRKKIQKKPQKILNKKKQKKKKR